jgi:hypothetical protein
MRIIFKNHINNFFPASRENIRYDQSPKSVWWQLAQYCFLSFINGKGRLHKIIEWDRIKGSKPYLKHLWNYIHYCCFLSEENICSLLNFINFSFSI